MEKLYFSIEALSETASDCSVVFFLWTSLASEDGGRKGGVSSKASLFTFPWWSLFKCRFSLQLSVKVFPHHEHKKGLSPLCDRL